MKPPRSPSPTWKPHAFLLGGRLSAAERDSLPSTAFAFPRSRKEPMTDAAHVRDAIARFNQVENVSDAERELAIANIRRGASHFGVHIQEEEWHKLGGRRENGRTETFPSGA